MKKNLSIFTGGLLTGIILALLFLRPSAPKVDVVADIASKPQTQTSADLDVKPVYTPEKTKIDSGRAAFGPPVRSAVRKPVLKKMVENIPDYIKPAVQILTVKKLEIDNKKYILSGYKSSRLFHFQYAESRVEVWSPQPVDSIRNTLTVDYASWFKAHQARQQQDDVLFLGITKRDAIVGVSVFGFTALAFTLAKGR